MSAPVAACRYPKPAGRIPVRVPRPVRPGVGPVMVTAPGGQPAPLITHEAHAAVCGFGLVSAATHPHPWDPRLGRCAGCGCWLVIGPARPGTVTR